ncbi:hypothetical protein Sango_2251200 [Sesamum angolense]|uniref:Uncharacterized protein n=1 Tax=Sesamum angolense TaxID=2727404 RepID=A0AAE1W998_9LAMI|nr:hypothetical protein Sango_2251200 [Sesamum angolense]
MVKPKSSLIGQLNKNWKPLTRIISMQRRKRRYRTSYDHVFQVQCYFTMERAMQKERLNPLFIQLLKRIVSFFGSLFGIMLEEAELLNHLCGVGHVLPGTLFLAIGAWHAWCSIVRYVASPNSFRVRIWNPVPGFDGSLRIFVNGVLNPAHMNNFEHSGMLLMFFIFGVITLLSEKTSWLPLPEGALFFIASATFTSEYVLFLFHSTSHMGLEGYYHRILVLLVGLCILSAIAGALVPTSFPVDLCIGIAIILQGLWFYQTAFTLYGPMMPDGCTVQDNMQIKCSSPEHEVHGELLANFQLFALVFCVLASVAAVYIYAEPRFSHPGLVNSLTIGNA